MLLKISSFKIFIFFILFMLLGVLALPKLSVKLNPSASSPLITVHYTWINSSPYTLERDITAKLEAGFSTIRGVKEIRSKSSKNFGSISLEFDKSKEIEIARFETATIIRQLYNKLPEEASYPTISVNSPNEEDSKAFLSYSIKANTSSFNIKETVSTQIQPFIGSLEDIDKTELYGARDKEYIISFNNKLLNDIGLTKSEVVESLGIYYRRTSLGTISDRNDYTTLAVEPNTLITDWHIPIKKLENRILYLDDFAIIKEQEQEARSYFRVNGDNSITLNIYATKKANTIKLSKEVESLLVTLKPNLPDSYSIIKTYDSTEYLGKELQKIYERSFYTILILLIFILLVSQSARYLITILISILANIICAFLLYYIFNIEIHLYSLAGITISLGLIIDNSIVMINHLRNQDNKDIFIPILASTLTTIGSLSIIYFLEDKYKVNLIGFAQVIIINLSLSLVIALVLIPALTSKLKLNYINKKEPNNNYLLKLYEFYLAIILFGLRFKKLFIVIIILAFGIPIFMLPNKLNNNMWYEKAYNNSFGNEWYLEKIRPQVDKYLGGSVRLFYQYVFNESKYSNNEETKLFVTAAMEKGATVHQMNAVFVEIENYLSQFTQIKQYITHVHSGDYARIEISFHNNAIESSFPFVLRSHLISKALDFGGLEWNIDGVGVGFRNERVENEPINMAVKAKGYNYDELNLWADTLKLALEKHPRIQEVYIRENNSHFKKDNYEYRFDLNKELIALSNFSPSEIISNLRQMSLSKNQDLYINNNNIYTSLRLESEQSKEFDIWHINNTPIHNSYGEVLTLKKIARIDKAREENNIYKENQEYIRLIDFLYIGAEKSGSKFLENQLEILALKLPMGYSFEKSEVQWFIGQDKDGNYTYLIFLVLTIIYFICAILFESFLQPFIILSVVPISFIGVFLTFYLFDFNFDEGGLSCFVLLSGLTVNASIFIIHGFNKLKKEYPGKSRLKLYIYSFKQKIFPILLTIFSTILGFIPFIKDGQNEVFWFALGVGTIGGLIFSLIGILFYLPIFAIKIES